MAHFFPLVSTTPAVASTPVDGNVDPPVASNINPYPPMADLAADVDAVPVNQPPLAVHN